MTSLPRVLARRPAASAFVLCALVWLGAAPAAAAQVQQATITGIVLLPDGQPADTGTVTLLDPLGAPIRSVPVARGTFTIANVAPGSYVIRADAPPLHAPAQQITVSSALAVKVELRLTAVAAEKVVIHGSVSGADIPTTRVTLAGEAIRRMPVRLGSRGLQGAIATAPGWSTEDNGLLHVRGVDDGFLYVIDGVPVYERLDGLFGMAPDPAMVESLNIVTGYIPPEFGWKAGGVLEVRSASRASDAWAGAVDVSAGGDRTRELSVVSGGPAGKPASITFGVTGQSSSRFLDPVHPGNLHNQGRAWSGGAQYGWSISPSDALTAVAGFGRSAFDVPHGEQQEAAGQDQRQRLGQYWQTLSWQRVWSGATVAQLAAYNRFGSSRLAGSDRDIPLFTDADRTLGRAGVLASASRQWGRHLVKAGAELSALRLREDFTFAVTDDDLGEEADLSEEALAHTPDNPFRFHGAAKPWLMSVYAQDSLRASSAMTIDAGVRVDWSRLIVPRSQVSPRAGIAYRLAGADTTLRASVGRFFQPPQPENILLASSELAWRLSPFRTDTSGGATLEPERQTLVEAGVDHMVAGRMRLDVAVWRRWIRNVADPNVFFGTTILFPNSVARGRASGIDVRLEVPRRNGWSGYLSYANARVVQFGPITGGLFLEDEVIEIGPGTPFTPDHDQRHAGSFGISFDDERRGLWALVTGRYESGTPLEVGDEEIDELLERPGAELVDFDRERVKPRLLFDATVSTPIRKRGTTTVSLRASVMNLTNRRFAYNFGNPFSGTHFGQGRTLQVTLRLAFR